MKFDAIEDYRQLSLDHLPLRDHRSLEAQRDALRLAKAPRCPKCGGLVERREECAKCGEVKRT